MLSSEGVVVNEDVVRRMMDDLRTLVMTTDIVVGSENDRILCRVVRPLG